MLAHSRLVPLQTTHYGAIMHLMRENWTDARLDDLNAKVDRLDSKVDRLDEKVDRGFERVDQHLEKIDDRFDALYRVLIQGLIGLIAAMVGGFATVLAAVIWV
jgi:hypothetical protein